MSIRHCINCVLAGVLISAAMLLVLAAFGSSATDTAEVTPPPGIELMITRTYTDGLDLAWSDASGNLVGYDLISDSSTGYDVISGTIALPVLASFTVGSTTGSVRGLACGVPARLWLVSGDGRGSNTVVGVTGPCGVGQ